MCLSKLEIEDNIAITYEELGPFHKITHFDLNVYIKRGRSHQTQRVNLSGLLFLFDEMIKARIYMFRCGKAPSSGLNEYMY